MSVQTSQPSRGEQRRTRVCLLLGIVVWYAHLNTIYGLASLACKWNWFPFTVAGVGGLQVIEALITLVALLIMLTLIVVPFRHWRRSQPENPAMNPQTLQETEQDRRPLLAFVAVLLNTLLFAFMVGTFVPTFALRVCNSI